MPFQLTPYQYPLITSAVLCLFLVLYLLTRKGSGTRGTISFICLLIFVAVWSMGSLFEIGFEPFAIKIAFHELNQIAMIWLPLTWLVFILPFTRWANWNKPISLAGLSVLPLLATILVETNFQHGWFWRSLDLSRAGPGHLLTSTLGPAGWAASVYGGVLVALSTFFLLKSMIGASGQKLGQLSMLLACTVIPWLGLTASTLPQASEFFKDVTPYIFNLTTFLFVFGLFRYRLLNVIPIGYQSMVDGMRDGVLVLNLESWVIHLNPAAEEILGQAEHELTGRPVEQALANHPALLESCRKDENEVLEEVILTKDGQADYYELHLYPLRDRFGYPIGRLMKLRNITKRVAAENASRQSQILLKQSEEKYRSLIENIDEAIFTAELNGNITYISPIVEQYSGFSPEQMVGQPFYQFVFPEDLPLLDDPVIQAISGHPQQVEFRTVDRAGSIHYVRMALRVVLHDNRAVGLQAAVYEITDRKQVEGDLERRASQLAILNVIGEQIAASIELNRVLDSATRLIQKYFGYYHVGIFTPNFDRGELLMRSASGAFSQFFPEDHHLKFGQGMVGWAAMNRRTLLANDVRLEPRYTNLFPDKVLTRAELAVPILVADKMVGVLDIQSPMVNAFDDNDVRVMETVADQIAIAMENARLYDEVRRQLKEREQKENMLRIQRDLLVRLSSAKRLEETFKIAVEMLAAELRASRVAISLVNWECQSIQPVVSLGYPLNRPNLPTTLDRNLAGWVARSAQPALISDANTETGELEFAPGTLAMLCAPLISNGKVIGVISLESGHAHAFSHDDLRLLSTLANSLVMLIERAQLFEEVEQARAELEKRATELEEANTNLRELDRLKSQFLANMSHELRTPLNSIIGFGEVLFDELAGNLNDEQKEFVQDILDSGRHLLALINDLLDFSKIESGRMILEPSTFEVRTLFEELRITVSPLVEKKSQTLVFRQDGVLPPFTADHLRIKQVFINLLSNSNKFTPANGTITVSCRCNDSDSLLFIVQDTGIGIRPEDQEIIFDEFRQADGSMTREVSGSGLGLTISKRIVEMHNGQIWVESLPGKGATFFVCLPVNGLAKPV